MDCILSESKFSTKSASGPKYRKYVATATASFQKNVSGRWKIKYFLKMLLFLKKKEKIN